MTPAAWLVDNQRLLPAQGRALDVACGRGRNALWLAERGLDTLAIDRDAEAIAYVSDEARRRRLPLTAKIVELETTSLALGESVYDLIVVVHYLHRPLFASLVQALRPGGLLVYETFTRAQAMRGKPTNPDFLLLPGELPRLMAPLEILRRREGDYDGRMVASAIGRKG